MEVELLAPGGSFESVIAAYNAGADAVYTGGLMFGARAGANNLTTEELIEALEYAHVHDRKLYLTVNTLLKDKEIETELYDYLLPLYEKQKESEVKKKKKRELMEDYPEVFGIDICSELIGQSKHTIYKLTSHKEIPCYRAESGRILRFRRDEIIAWMMAKRQETKQEFIESMELGFTARLRK